MAKSSQDSSNKQIVSKRRIADHGEVFTAPREVNAMLDLVKQETQRIDSRFLEPACGKGAFLTEILRRKLEIVNSRYRKSQIEYERYMALAVSSIYGIDILSDNVADCRSLLLGICIDNYASACKLKCECIPTDFIAALRFILSKNIVLGDALTLKRVYGAFAPFLIPVNAPIKTPISRANLPIDLATGCFSTLPFCAFFSSAFL